MEKPVVGFCRVSTQACGLTWLGYYLASIRHCVVSGKAVLVLEPLPHHTKPVYSNYTETALDIVCRLLENNVPVIAEFEEGESRTGLHWVKAKCPVARLEEISPIPLRINIAQWVEDTPYGKVIYYANGTGIRADLSRDECAGIPIVKTVFRSTLENLVAQNKAVVDYEDDCGKQYKITDEQLAEVAKKYFGTDRIHKSNVPNHILEHTTVIPL